jgi:hypothetical protein
MELTHERLKTQLKYEPDTGLFYWIQPRRGVQLNKPAGRVSTVHGYREICIDKKLYRAHRLAWFLVHGCWPVVGLDHINRVKDDNRIENLRECNQIQNMLNCKPSKSNQSGFKGVSWDAQRNKWLAQIRISGKKKNLGRYSLIEDAKKAWITEASKDVNSIFRSA